MDLSAVIKSISINRTPGPSDIVFGYLLDREGNHHRFCLERDVHGWYFDERTEIPDCRYLEELQELVLRKALPLINAMEVEDEFSICG